LLAFYVPDTATPATAMDGVHTLPYSGIHLESPAISLTDRNRLRKSVAMVASRTGLPASPASINRPVIPTEISPLTGFTPECKPDRLST
jgi:hypothetical protein